MQRLAEFRDLRPLLFSIAYRMLGSVSDAEDILQEAFLRWQAAEASVQSPKSYLSAVVTRLCIDHLRSARVQREQYVGPWLPEPLLTEAGPPPSEALALSESLSTAFLLLLETLSPAERAVFLLREVFDYDYAEIQDVVGKSEENCRQMLSRARRHIAEGRPRFPAPPEEHERITLQFLQTCASGDLPGMLQLLADQVEMRSDSGGKANAARRVVRGADKVSRFFAGILRKAGPSLHSSFAQINGRLGLIVYHDGRLQSTMSFEVAEGRIRTIYFVLNPDKLRHVPQAG